MPPNTNVTVLLSVSCAFLTLTSCLMRSIQYVVDMSEDDQIDTVRFQFQSHVRARYGAPPNSILYHDTTQSGPLSITVDIEMPGDILDVTSLNHNPFNDLPVPPIIACTPRAGQSRHFVRKQFVSVYFDFGKDFLLTVHALGLGRPRCFAERLSHEENLLRSIVGPTTALALTIIPRFDLKGPPAQEYIFLIDRSLSMQSHRINMAKQALKLLLTQLPSTNSMFNVYSFGGTFQAMWCKSLPYVDATLREAVRYFYREPSPSG
jgi:von Willebrand factor type A domain